MHGWSPPAKRKERRVHARMMPEKLNDCGKIQEVAGDKANQMQFRCKQGSVIPAKRKLVKTMVFNSIVGCISSVFGSDRASHSSSTPQQTTDDATKVSICPGGR